MALQPAILGAERIWNRHCLGGDEDVKPAVRSFSTSCAPGMRGRSSKKSSASRKARTCFCRSSGAISQTPSANQVFDRQCLIELLVVAAQML